MIINDIDTAVREAVKCKYGLTNYILVDARNHNYKVINNGIVNDDTTVVYFCGIDKIKYVYGNTFSLSVYVTTNKKEVECLLGL